MGGVDTAVPSKVLLSIHYLSVGSRSRRGGDGDIQFVLQRGQVDNSRETRGRTQSRPAGEQWAIGGNSSSSFNPVNCSIGWTLFPP